MEEKLVLYNVKLEIGVSEVGGVWTYAELAKGIDNVDEALNETIQQYFFLSGKGFADNEITGMAPSYTLTGRRVHGDAAQDYVFGNKYKLGAFRKSSLRVSVTDNSSGSAVVKTATVGCTICNIKEISGATSDNSAISMELRFDGEPATANVAGLPPLVVVSLAASVGSGKTQLYVNPAKGAGNTYKYKTAISVAMLALGASAAAWTSWDGAAEITAVTGHVIAVVECDASGNAVKGGSAIVTSKA
ncbi:MAG: phage tail tube protein [Eubacteriales bacterium]